jgi:hypothetical protein
MRVPGILFASNRGFRYATEKTYADMQAFLSYDGCRIVVKSGGIVTRDLLL